MDAMKPTPADFFLSARDTWLQALQVLAAAKEKKLDPSPWPTSFSLATNPDDPSPVSVKIPRTPNPQLDLWAENVVIATFGDMALAAHDALQASFGANGDPLNDQDPDRRALRCIWYMIRCAFAHPTAGTPTWKCRNDYKDVFTVQGSITLDAAALHGQQFAIEHVGGWGEMYGFLQRTNQILGLPT